MAQAIAVSAQQSQKYETGQNRISAARLHDLAHFLETPIGWFFEPGERDPVEPNGRERTSRNRPHGGVSGPADTGLHKDILTISKPIRGLARQDSRRRAVRLIRLMLHEIDAIQVSGNHANASRSANAQSPTGRRLGKIWTNYRGAR